MGACLAGPGRASSTKLQGSMKKDSVSLEGPRMSISGAPVSLGRRGRSIGNERDFVLDGPEFLPGGLPLDVAVGQAAAEGRTMTEKQGTEILARQFSRASEAELLELAGELEHISTIYKAVFKLFVTHALPNYSMPWAKQQQTSSIGSAFAVDLARKRFITNAHCVDEAVVVQVLKRGDTKKYFAKVLCIGDSCDLALLTVESDTFWEGVPDIMFGEGLKLQDTVNVIGYPVGGQNLAITQGVVSRIDLTEYSQSFQTQALLTVQIDAAINPGNSGGPVLNDKMEIVGVAFQGLSSAENTGYIIPMAVVERFVEDFVRNSTFTGFCSLAIEAQSMENDDLREMYKMTEGQTGILIRSVAPETDAARVLQADDVLLKIGEHVVANDGTVPFDDGERINAIHLVNSNFRGDQLEVEVLRNGKELSLSYRLDNPQLLVPPKPGQLRYFIVAGLVFIPISLELLNQRFMLKKYGEFMVPTELRRLEQYRKYKNEEVVVLNNILRHEVNAGYAMDMYRLTKFNGEEVRNLGHLVDLVEGCTDEWSKWEFDGCKDMIVLKTSKIQAATEEVVKQNMIPAAKYLARS